MVGVRSRICSEGAHYHYSLSLRASFTLRPAAVRVLLPLFRFLAHFAWQIVENGFEVKKSRAGKRFGFGGYFSEDPAVADRYAGEGEGLYRACYALLLCRVLLGRQYRTTKFRDESVTEEAFRQRFDSVLAEPNGHLHREFVIFDGHQVYPEYALVYERLSADCWICPSPVQRYWADEEADSAEMGSWSLPAYWFHAREELTGAFHETHPDQQMKAVLEDLMNKTWLSDPTGGIRPGHAGHHEHATARTVGCEFSKSSVWKIPRCGVTTRQHSAGYGTAGGHLRVHRFMCTLSRHLKHKKILSCCQFEPLRSEVACIDCVLFPCPCILSLFPTLSIISIPYHHRLWLLRGLWRWRASLHNHGQGIP